MNKPQEEFTPMNYDEELFWTSAESIVTYKDLIEKAEKPTNLNQANPDEIYSHLKTKRFIQKRVEELLIVNECLVNKRKRNENK